MEKLKTALLKISYGTLFVGVLPVLLILWARGTSHLLSLPVPEVQWPGYVTAAAGLVIIGTGMHNLWFFGKGLPMNAFPPEKLVSQGIYAVIRHPIYTGASLMSFGLSAIWQSSSGLWLVSPLFTLMMAAYVAGFENERTNRISGASEYLSFLSLPNSKDSSPSFRERVPSWILSFLPWALVYETFILAGIPENAWVSNLPFEKNLGVIEASVIFYLSVYPFALLVPMIIPTRRVLRMFIADIWFVSFIAGLAYFLIPVIVDQREFIPQSFFGELILTGRKLDGITAALPSFHVIWAFTAARYFTISFGKFRALWYLIAILVSISCIATGNHSVPDVIGGFIVFLAARYRVVLWDFIRSLSERIANSWQEWRWGPLRLINHGLYGGAAGFAGTLIACCFTDQKFIYVVPLIMVFVITGAGLWAQIIEGSHKLLRPYGYYGGLSGGLIACIAASLVLPLSLVAILGAFAMAAPWIQALGRIRCLVQGCCHGKPAGRNIGIRFTHPLSRVNKISGLNGVPLHPTQLYSIASNILSGLVLFRLYTAGMPAIFITGMYLIMNGLGRFVEESLRGEAQTPYFAGMRIYQWIAIINIVAGAVLTTIPDPTKLTFGFSMLSLVYSAITAALVTFASGVDFPESNRRYARLTTN